MTAPVQILLVIVGVAVSAQARLNATVLGQHFSVPVLGLVVIIVVLVLLVVVLWLARSILRDGLRLRPAPVMNR